MPGQETPWTRARRARCKARTPDEIGTLYADLRELHRALHAAGAAIMLTVEPAARWLLEKVGAQVDEDRVAKWRRLAPDPTK